MKKLPTLSCPLSVLLLVPLAVAVEDNDPLKPADTSSPRATYKTFVSNLNNFYRDYLENKKKKQPSSEGFIYKIRVIRCLDLTAQDQQISSKDAFEKAVLLMEVFNRIKRPPEDQIPDQKGVEKLKKPEWTIPGTAITFSKIEEGPRAGEFLISPSTIERAEEFYLRAKKLKYQEGTVLPDAYEIFLSTDFIPTEQTDHPLRPADTSSPQATLQSFRQNMNQVFRLYIERRKRNEVDTRGKTFVVRAIRCLNLENIPPTVVQNIAKEKAILLMEVLDRIVLPPEKEIPDQARVAKKGISSWTIPNTDIEIERIEEGPRKGEFLFSPKTVERAEEFYLRVIDMPYKEGTVLENAYEIYVLGPGWMIPDNWIVSLPHWAKETYWKQPVWKWIVFFLVIGFALAIFALIVRFATVAREESPKPFWMKILTPISLFIFSNLIEFLVSQQIRMTSEVLLSIEATLTVINLFAASWIAILFCNALATLLISTPRIQSQSIDAHMLRMLFRLLSVGIIVYLILLGAQMLAIPLTPVLAGLGVGGVAVALAAQNSMENLIGGFNLFTDRPVRVGEFCRFGDQIGTIEEIGIRSTRVRTLGRTVVSVPNASFSKMELENYSRRDKIWYNPKISLRYETTPDQIRYILIEVRKLLYSHPKVDPDPARIRFTGFGAYSLDLDIFSYITVTDYGEFLEVAEDLNLHLMDIIAQSGTDFAIPARRTYNEAGKGMDESKVHQTEKTVDQWRANQLLFLPKFPEEEIARLQGSLDYPPKGAPKDEIAPKDDNSEKESTKNN